MANIVDTLVTRLLLDGSEYRQGSEEVLKGTERLASGMGNVRSAIGGVLDHLKMLAVAGVAIGGTLLGAAIAGGQYAVNTAISFDTISRSLTAVTKDAERAKTILRFDDQLAGPSIFTSEDLADASLHLEAFKLTTERFLPVAEKLGTVFGANKSALDSYVDALGYINNGRFGEGFESLSRAGLSRQDFQAEGLQFDKGGSFKGTAEQALAAVEKIVSERFGKLSEEMANGPAAKLASVMDAWGRAARQAGYAILTFLMPAAERVGDFIAYLVDSGAIQKAADGFANLFDGKAIGDGLVKALALVVAVFEKLPQYIKTAMDFFADRFNEARITVIKLVSIMAALFVGETIVNGIMAIIEAYRVWTTVIKGAAMAQALLTGLTGAGLAVVGAALVAMVGVGKALDSALPKFGGGPGPKMPENDIEKRAREIEAGFKKATGQDDKGKPSAPPATPSTQLDKIARSTERTAIATEKAVDIQTKLEGGSTLAAEVTSDYGMYRSMRGASRSRAEQLVRELMDELSGLHEAPSPMRGRRGISTA